MLRTAAEVLDRIDRTARELDGLPTMGGTVRLGYFTSAGAALVPRAIARLRRESPDVTVTTREGSTPALVRALRARTLDLAVIASVPPFRPPDAESPALNLEVLVERTLYLAVPATDPLAGADSVDVGDLRGRRWVASPSTSDEPRHGVWPGLDERPDIAHVARDWLAKLQLVAAGCGLTTLPSSLVAAVPAGVRALPVRGGPREERRVLLAHLSHPLPEPAARLAAALRSAVAEVDATGPAAR